MQSALAARGGTVLAVSVDAPADHRQMVDDLGLSFPLLSNEGREVVRRYDLLHRGGGPDGTDIAIPAQLLVKSDGAVVWSFVARRVPERVDPALLLEQIALFWPVGFRPVEEGR